MRISLLIPLLAAGLAGCSSSNSSVGVGVGTGYYGSAYGAYPWWYDDYFYYWDHYYPWCCDNQGDFDELIKKWWSGLDGDRQQEIKDKFHDWQDNHGGADLAALRGDFATRWHAMSPEQKEALREHSKLRPSVSNPERAPHSPLDERAARAGLDRSAGGEHGALLPTSRPQTEGGLLAPAQTRPEGELRPHLPSNLAPPLARPAMPHRMAPPMRSFPGIRRR
ncbi:hypothetical protein [Aeromonas veronii]|uniref:hypothetical protein n=1 Tax=Aeromonas veronii TaxID=654 RepID=UPI0032EB45D2